MSTGKICDRYRTAKDIKSYRIQLRPGEGGEPILDRSFDLGPRGLAWIKNLIEHDIAKLDDTEGAGGA